MRRSPIQKRFDRVVNRLHSKGITAHEQAPQYDGSFGYNCWGFTAALLDEQEELRWLPWEDMEDFLANRTEHVEGTPQVGDIAVFREGPELEHTAVVTRPCKTVEKVGIIHKPGPMDLEHNTIGHSYQRHPEYGVVTEFRRFTR